MFDYVDMSGLDAGAALGVLEQAQVAKRQARLQVRQLRTGPVPAPEPAFGMPTLTEVLPIRGVGRCT